MATYPEDLNHPFSRGDLSLLGIGWREISGPLWRSPYMGVHVWGLTDPYESVQRALDASLLVPRDGAIGGWAAARIGGVEELDGTWRGKLLPVPLALPPKVVRRRGPSVVPWRSMLLPEDITEINGVRVTTPVRTAFDIARRSPLLLAVTALDVLARGRPEFLTEVATYADERARWLGVPPARRALAYSTPRARSPRETALRLFWLLECALPAPRVNANVFREDGSLLGMVDLLDDASGLVAEYDGAAHRQEKQHALDNAREEDLEDDRLTVVRVTNPDLGRYRTRTRQRLLSGWRRARHTPRGCWTWAEGPLPPRVPHW